MVLASVLLDLVFIAATMALARRIGGRAGGAGQPASTWPWARAS